MMYQLLPKNIFTNPRNSWGIGRIRTFLEYVCGVQGSLPSWVAFTIFGVASAVGGVLSLLLPETLGSSLPDTFQDIKVSILTIVR